MDSERHTDRTTERVGMFPGAMSSAEADAELQRDHDRALAREAMDLNDELIVRIGDFQRAAMEKAQRPLRSAEMRAIAMRTLIQVLLERGHACAQCCRRIASVDEAIAAEREVRDDDGNPVRVWTLVHAPDAADAMDPNSCLSRARARRVYMQFLRYPALPYIEAAEPAPATADPCRPSLPRVA